MSTTIQRRNTHQRQLVLDAVRARTDHPTADAIYADVHVIDPKISRGTVYRNLNLLSDEGVIRTIEVPGKNRFDLRVDAHAHLMCRMCGDVCDSPLPYDETLDHLASTQTGYDVDCHNTVFLGLCPSCKLLKTA